MVQVIRYITWIITRIVIPLRYRIVLKGWPPSVPLKPPVLLLPNHPGLIDPVLILTTFYGTLRPRTVLFEGNFPGLVRVLLVRLLDAVAIPDLTKPNPEAHQRTERAIEEVIEGLHKGENFVLWPSGHAQRDGVEHLRSARALADILKAVPEVTIVTVRTRGVWGSMFSVAQTGKLPDLFKCLVKGAGFLLANFVLLMPRRPVEMTVRVVNRKDLPGLNRESVNRWFEEWYNVGSPEKPTFVPYHFLSSQKDFDYPPLVLAEEPEIELKKVPAEIRSAVIEILKSQVPDVDSSGEPKPETHLEDLGLDSLQRMELALAIEQRFGHSSDIAPVTIGHLYAMAQGLGASRTVPAPKEWFSQPENVTPLKILAETIPEAFMERARTTPRDVVSEDDFSGVLTYGTLATAALIMARRFSKLPGKNVGLMLPASVASDTMLLGLYLANKLPILLNWTTGPANLQHAAKLTELSHVITSRTLRERLNLSIEGVTFIDVEDLRKDVGKLERIWTFVKFRLFAKWISRTIPKPDLDDMAVVLFTSGSEKAPKAVPLTHRNIISNIRILPVILDLSTRDAVLGSLPMFHSFGFTLTGLFPLLAGIRVIHHPDPTDAAALARKIGNYKPTVVVGMPSLIAHLYERSRPGELQSVRLIAVGAEKCPEPVFDLISRTTPDALVLEGYGITECSPMVCANQPGKIKRGTIGKTLPTVDLCVVDLNSNETLPAGKVGMLLVSGPSVFKGYWGTEDSPFVQREGKQWYKTGDLVEFDQEGFIHFRGRLKRFIKAGGEMISLPALEEPFTTKYPPNDEGIRVAVEGVETERGRQIVLFTTFPLELAEANDLLVKSGFRGVMRLDAVRQLKEIPQLGTGKIDYKALRAILAKEQAGQTN